MNPNKCMKCGRKMEYVREESAPKGNKRFYTCWKCDTSYIVVPERDTLIRVQIQKAR